MDYQANIAYHRGMQRRNWQENSNNNGRHFGNLNDYNSGARQFGGGNSNQMQNFQDKIKGKGQTDDEEPKRPCQICYRRIHTAVKCCYRFKKNFVPKIASNRKSAYIAQTGEHRDRAWYLDSGAIDNVTKDFNNLSINSEYKGNNQLVVGNGSKLKIASIGHTLLNTLDPQTLKYIKLNHILYVPEITKNLISISKLLHDNNV